MIGSFSQILAPLRHANASDICSHGAIYAFTFQVSCISAEFCSKCSQREAYKLMGPNTGYYMAHEKRTVCVLTNGWRGIKVKATFPDMKELYKIQMSMTISSCGILPCPHISYAIQHSRVFAKEKQNSINICYRLNICSDRFNGFCHG